MRVRISDGMSEDCVLVLPYDLSFDDMAYLLSHPDEMQEFAKKCVLIKNLGGGTSSTVSA